MKQEISDNEDKHIIQSSSKALQKTNKKEIKYKI